MMDKEAARARLAAIETETAELRRIIDAPDKPKGLWVPRMDEAYWYVPALGTIDFQQTKYNSKHDRRNISRYNAFPTKELAERAAAMQADANLLIAAALQADPEAGPRSPERQYCVVEEGGRYLGIPDKIEWHVPVPHVHTQAQADEMARLINEELAKRKGNG